MVKKLKVKVTAEELAIAEANGIAANTVYARLNRGWDKQRALAEPPRNAPQLSNLGRNEEGSLISDSPKGKQRSIRLPEEWDEAADRAIAGSGLTQSEWVAMVVVNHLKQQQQKKRSRKAAS